MIPLLKSHPWKPFSVGLCGRAQSVPKFLPYVILIELISSAPSVHGSISISDQPKLSLNKEISLRHPNQDAITIL